MSHIIRKSSTGSKQYEGLSEDSKKKSEELLAYIIKVIDEYQTQLEEEETQSSIVYRYKIGKMLRKLVDDSNTNPYERLFLWDEIRHFTNSNLQSTKDRSAKRGFYEYCYRLSSFSEEIAFKFSWRQWCEILDRSLIAKDSRLIDWLAINIDALREEDFRIFLLIINDYLKKTDTTIFSNEELHERYDSIFKIAESWRVFYKKYFDCRRYNLTRARKKSFSKYRKKYCQECLIELKHNYMIPNIHNWESIFRTIFVDVDKSINFGLSENNPN